MKRHLDSGKHDRALERETLMDRAATAYAERREGQTTSVPEIQRSCQTHDLGLGFDVEIQIFVHLACRVDFHYC